MIIQIESGHKIEVPDGATPAQIDEVIGHFAQSKPAPGPKTSTEPEQKRGFIGELANDTKNFIKSTAYSVPMGFGDEIRDVVAAGTASLAPDVSFKDAYKMAREQTQQEQSQMRKDSPIASVAGDIAGSVLTGVGAAGTKAGASLATGLRSGNPLTRIAKGIGAGAVSGATYGAGTAEGDNRLLGAVKGGLVGGALGGAVPAVTSAVSGIKSAVAPQIEKTTADLAKRARDFGIPLRLDQISPTRVRNTVQKISQEIPGSGVDAFEATQRQAFTKAVAGTLGENADNLGPETINSFLKNAKLKFRSAIGTGKFNIEPDDFKSIDKIKDSASKNLTSDVADIVKRHVEQFKNDIASPVKSQNLSILDQYGTPFRKDDLVQAVKNIDVNKLSSLRSDIIDSLPKIDSQARPYVAEIVDSIDTIVERQINPKAAELLKTARKEWRNYKTIEPLLEKSPEGMINPTDLINRVATSPYIKASRKVIGEDDLVDLARVGKQFIKIKGGSDTAQKAALMQVIRNPLTALAGGAGAGLATIGSAGTGAALTGAGMLANRGLQNLNGSQRLIDLAIKNSGKVTRQLSRPSSTLMLEGAAGGMAAR